MHAIEGKIKVEKKQKRKERKQVYRQANHCVMDIVKGNKHGDLISKFWRSPFAFHIALITLRMNPPILPPAMRK